MNAKLKKLLSEKERISSERRALADQLRAVKDKILALTETPDDGQKIFFDYRKYEGLEGFFVAKGLKVRTRGLIADGLGGERFINGHLNYLLPFRTVDFLKVKNWRKA